MEQFSYEYFRLFLQIELRFVLGLVLIQIIVSCLGVRIFFRAFAPQAATGTSRNRRARSLLS